MLTAQQKRIHLREGLEHLRKGEFFAAHEAWEIPWMEMTGASRIFWQAMIQLSVGAYHYRNNNLNGCRNLWQKALARCEILLAEKTVTNRSIVSSLRGLLEQCLGQVNQEGDPIGIIHDFSLEQMNDAWIDFG